MSFFTQGFVDFFQELATHNDREWFHAHKKQYERDVKEPFKAFVAHMIGRVQEHEPAVKIEPKQAIFRINRDIRFSKDKTPYKLYAGAALSPGGRKDMRNPGLYFHLSPLDSMVATGVYMPDKEDLYRIREAIAHEPDRVDSILADPKLKDAWGEVQGDKNKRLPREFKEAAEHQPLLFNKQFYLVRHFQDAAFPLRPDLDDYFIDLFLAADSWNAFLKEALSE